MAASVTKRRPAAVFLTAVFFILAYFALFPYPLGRELVARPAWAVTVPQPGDAAAQAAGPVPSDDSSVAPFQLGDLFGYVSADGAFEHVERMLAGVALSDTGYVNYARLGTDWILRDRRGRRVASFSGNGYPLLSPDGTRLFVIKSDLSGMVELDRNGDVRWERDFPSLLTTLSVQGGAMLAGMIDGRASFVDSSGEGIDLPLEGGSRISVVLGAAVTADGGLAATVSGIDPQALMLYRRRTAGFTPAYRQTLSSDIRRELRVAFSPGGRYLAWEGTSAVGFLDPRTGRSSRLSQQGSLTGLAFPEGGRFAAVSAGGGGNAFLTVAVPLVGPVFTSGFVGHDTFLGVVGGHLLLGLDGRLMRIDVVAQ